MKCSFCPQRANQHCGQKERIFETVFSNPSAPASPGAVSGDVWALGFPTPSAGLAGGA